MDAMNRQHAVPNAQQAPTTRQWTDGVRETPSAALPRIALPKGGGAIRGIGEKFAANPVTGTGSMSVPLATSPSRAGFGPQLTLSYDSGAGNGSFGFGWGLSLPSITRKTDKGLPKYQDTEESDVFMLSGAEDLVPVLKSDGAIDETRRAATWFAGIVRASKGYLRALSAGRARPILLMFSGVPSPKTTSLRHTVRAPKAASSTPTNRSASFPG